jgi:two-component system, response regulator PdtaR
VGLNVLIVEDEMLVSEELEMRLEDLGHHVVGQAVSGEEALEIAKKRHLDVVFMDMRLRGELDGAQTAIRLATEAHEWIPTVFVTAYPKSSLRKFPHSVVLTKPFSSMQLLRAIEAVVEKEPYSIQ